MAEEHNEGGNIMVGPHVDQVPSRMMLAMGDYSALQSFEYGQVCAPVTFPRRAPNPSWTSDYWKRFEAHPDLYPPSSRTATC